MRQDQLLAAMRSRHEAASDQELAAIVADGGKQYTPEAVASAQAILARRGADIEQIAVAAERAEIEKRRVSDAPLGSLGRFACFAWCGLPGLIIYGFVRQAGRTRAANDALRFLVAGWLLRLGLVSLVLKAILIGRLLGF